MVIKNMKKKINADILISALGVALFPPIWAVLAPHIGVTTGAVALICAGLYAANGGKKENALKISVGFLLGDFWAVLALWLMKIMQFNPDAELFITLFVLGGLAVLISAVFDKFIFCPSWLCGWAIGLTILSPLGYSNIGTVPIEIAVSMLVGVWYVGVFVDAVHGTVIKFIENRKENDK